LIRSLLVRMVTFVLFCSAINDSPYNHVHNVFLPRPGNGGNQFPGICTISLFM